MKNHTDSAPASPADSNREKKLKIIPRKMNIYLKFVL